MPPQKKSRNRSHRRAEGYNQMSMKLIDKLKSKNSPATQRRRSAPAVASVLDELRLNARAAKLLLHYADRLGVDSDAMQPVLAELLGEIDRGLEEMHFARRPNTPVRQPAMAGAGRRADMDDEIPF
jgi:hypothetical protein